MSDLFSIEQAVESLEVAVGRVEKAVGKVEEAVNDRYFSPHQFIWGFAGWALILFTTQMWHSEWRYKIQYSLDSAPIVFEKEPHDCAFFSAPLGEKHCHYERAVVKIQWATSTIGEPIESLDDGRTWSPFTPENNAVVPKGRTLKRIIVTWKKQEE